MKLRNGILACLLATLTLVLTPASLATRAQLEQTATASKSGYPSLPPEEGHAFLVALVDGEAACRDATPAERLYILKRDPSVRTTPVRTAADPFNSPASQEGGTGSSDRGLNQTQGHLDIVLRPTAQLQANAQAMAAFERAAATWENLITSEITVVVDVDFGTTRFGTPYSPGVLGSTSGGIFYTPSYSDVRNRLVAHASESAESTLYASLPAGNSGVPTDAGTKTQMDMESPQARALGAIAAHADPNDTTGNDRLGRAPSIGFNSSFPFDFDPSNGISAGQTDFDAVAVHEMGHLLGFVSEVGLLDLDPSWTLRPTLWDLFRFRPGTTLSTFSTAQRVLTTGGEHRYFDGTPELRLSTGNPAGQGGDGRQASHWKDDSFGTGYVGIMDPTIGSGVRRQMTDNDRRAINFMGYNLGALPAAPANDNFVNAVTLQGATGTAQGTNVNAGTEAGEPTGGTSGGRSVWYKWTAPATGTATFDTTGSDFDTTLAVFNGTAIGQLSLVAENDDIDTQAGNVASRVQFNTTTGTVYHIKVDGFDGDSGNIQLNWTTTGTPEPIPTGLQYYPLAHPVRLLDTRAGAAACFTPASPLAANASRTQAAVGTCDGLSIPATAKAIVGNATVVAPPASGHITLYPSDAALPTASNLNYVAGRIVPNAFTVGLSAAGAFNIYTPTQTHFIVDVAGYYAPPGQGGLYYHPLPRPVRLLDTRPGATACDAPGAPLQANASRTETARTTCGGVIIPNDAQAVVGNATVVTPPAGGFITLYPSGAALPTVSNLNYLQGQIIPNAFTVTVGSDGAFNIFTPTSTHFIADITGYYSASAAPDSNEVAGLLFYPLSAPARLLDTRAGTTACFTPGAPLAANSVRTQQARGACAGSTVPTSALAVLGNATVVTPTATGYIILYPSGATQPVVSNLNYLVGQIIPNAFNVTVGGDGAFNIFTPSQTHFIVDMSGYFAP